MEVSRCKNQEWSKDTVRSSQHSSNLAWDHFLWEQLTLQRMILLLTQTLGCSTNLVLQWQWPGDQLSVWVFIRDRAVKSWGCVLGLVLLLLPLIGGHPSCGWIKQQVRVEWCPFLSLPWATQQVTGGETECQPTIFNAFLLRIRNRRYTRPTKGKNLRGPGPSCCFCFSTTENSFKGKKPE